MAHNLIHDCHTLAHALRRDWPAIRHVLDRLYWLLFPAMVLGVWALGEAWALAWR